MCTKGCVKMKINCDNCNAEVNKEPLKKHFGDLEITYLICEECSMEYVIIITDSYLREKIEKASQKESILKSMSIDQRQKVTSLKVEYENMMREARREKVKRRIEKEFKRKVAEAVAAFNNIYLPLKNEYEKIKKENIEYEKTLKKMYE